MEMKNILKSSVAAGALFALAAPMASGSAEAGIKNQNSKMNLTVGGQIARTLAYADDGQHSQLFQLDNPSSGTRIRFILSGQVTESVSIGGLIEYDLHQDGENAKFTTTTGNDEAPDTALAGRRHHFIDFKHKSMGTISMGRGNTATNGYMEEGYNSSFLNAKGSSGVGSMGFTTAGGAVSTTVVSNVSNTLDNPNGGRNNRLRYDTPSIAGFGLAASLQDDGTTDVALRYKGKIAGLSVKGALGYANSAAASTTIDKTIGGSVAVKHSSGLSLSGSYGKRDMVAGNTNEAKAWRIGGGYDAKLSSLGNTLFSIDYWNIEDDQTEGDEFTSLRVSVIQKLAAAGSDIGVMWDHHSFDDTNTTNNYDDIDVIWLGAKLNF